MMTWGWSPMSALSTRTPSGGRPMIATSNLPFWNAAIVSSRLPMISSISTPGFRHRDEPAQRPRAFVEQNTSLLKPRQPAKTPADYAYNVAVTHKVVGFAHAIGVSVEAELGCLGSLETLAGDKEDGHGAEGKLSREQLLTDPDEAASFVDETQCDALAIAIGTSHGAYKFKHQPTGDVLAIDRIKAIHRSLPNTHLVMHGSSSVHKSLVEEFRCCV